MIEIRHIRYLVAIAEEQNFTNAARRLHLAQPGLSHHISELERQIGAQLVDRSRRPVSLTPAGEALVEEGRRVLIAFDEAIEHAQRIARGDVGRMRLGSVPSASFDILPRLLRAYRDRYPDVNLVVREMTTPGQVDALRRGEIDVGMIRIPYDIGDLATHLIREEGIGLLLPTSHPLTKYDQVPLIALDGHPMVLFPAGPQPTRARSFIPRLCRDAGFEPNIVQEAMDSAMAISFVAAGTGVTLVPESMQGIVRQGVVYRPIAPPTPTLALVAIHRPGDLSPTVGGLLEVLEKLWPAGERGNGGTGDKVNGGTGERVNG